MPVLGTTDDLVQVLSEQDIDCVVFAEGSFASGAEMRRTAWLLESLSIQMIVVPALSGVSGTRVAVRPVAGLPLIYVERPRTERALRLAKRTFDIVGSLAALTLFSIPMLIAVMAIRLDDRGPILFRQRRVGHLGTQFECLKLRTMGVDAEARLAEVRHLSDGGATELYKIQEGPPDHAGGRDPAPLLPRRGAAAAQRAPGRHEPRRAASGSCRSRSRPTTPTSTAACASSPA